MVTTQFSKERFVAALEDAGVPEDALRENYSGRRMHGETCPAIVVDSMREALQFAGALGAGYNYHGDGGDDFWIEILGSATFDQMGLGWIVYFPGLELTEKDSGTVRVTGGRGEASVVRRSIQA